MSNDDDRILTPLSNLVFEHFSLAELGRLQEICNSNADKDCNGIPDWIANVSLRLKDSSRKEQTEYSKVLVGRILYIERTGIRQARLFWTKMRMPIAWPMR